jgi:ribose/xylose/arabinose/galactoside ABC-type transport system permease subunit
LKKFAKRKEFGIILIIVVMSVFLTIISSAFFRLDNIIDILRSNAVFGIMAFGMLPVIITGGIDLSVASSIALCSVIAGKVMTTTDTNIVVVFAVAILVGGLVGLINGLIITKLQIAPLVATLGVTAITLGCVLLYTGGTWISGLPTYFKTFGQAKIGSIAAANNVTLGIPSQVVILVLAGVITWLILKYTLIGRGIYAVGGSESSAVRVGYNVSKIKIFAYIYCGIMTGIAAVAHTSIVQQVDPNTFIGYDLTVISIIVIGGASTMGGIGTVLGTTLGIILMGILQNGLILAKIPTFWQKIVMGLVIIVAISVDVINRKREQSKLVRVDVEE